MRTRTAKAGQSLAEFAIIVPVFFLILIAIADLGRIYTSAVAVESAGREAADYGAFEAEQWSAVNITTTVDEMKRRACVAAQGSHLEGYAQSDPADDKTCTNPAFSCTLERGSDSQECGSSGGWVDGVDCSLDGTDPPCTVHVQLNYSFQTFFAIPPMPASIPIVRDSRFRMSNLAEPTAPP